MRILAILCLPLLVLAVLLDGPPTDPAAPEMSASAYTAPARQAPVVAPEGTFELDTLDVTGEAPPPPPPRVQRFEDGSWRNLDTGETGCRAGALCDQESPDLPAVTDWTHGFPPCAYEDGSGGPIPCYWDASTRGNGVGRSYIVWTED